MRFEWTPEGYQRVLAHGLDPAEVHEALRGPGPRLLEAVAADFQTKFRRGMGPRSIELLVEKYRNNAVPDICKTLAISKATFYRYVTPHERANNRSP